MSNLVKAVRNGAGNQCVAKSYRKKGCTVSLKTIAAGHIVVDLDCALNPRQKRCDFLFVGEHRDHNWVVPIELKGGEVKADTVVKQLQGGAIAASKWLPTRSAFRFRPVLVHRKNVHRKERLTLRARKVKCRKHERQVELIHCGAPLASALL